MGFSIPLAAFERTGSHVYASGDSTEVPETPYPTIEAEYRATIRVGTPPQSYNVLLDTGSYDMWLFGTECVSNGCDAAIMNKYSVASSKTGVDLGVIAENATYADGETYGGRRVADNIQIGNLSVAGFPFTQVSYFTAPWNPGGASNVDGIVGMGFRPLDSTQNSFAQELIAQGSISRGIFSYFIALDELSGAVTLGGYNASQFQDTSTRLLQNNSSILTHNNTSTTSTAATTTTTAAANATNATITNSTANTATVTTTASTIIEPIWIPYLNDSTLSTGKIALPLAASRVNGVIVDLFANHTSPQDGEVEGNAGSAILDTGTSQSIVTQTLVDEIARQLNATVCGDGQVRKIYYSAVTDANSAYTYQVPCGCKSETEGGAPVVSLEFASGVMLGITANEYISKPQSTATGGSFFCQLQLRGVAGGYGGSSGSNGGSGTYLAGNTFLKRYVTVFDFDGGRVGFALALGRSAALPDSSVRLSTSPPLVLHYVSGQPPSSVAPPAPKNAVVIGLAVLTAVVVAVVMCALVLFRKKGAFATGKVGIAATTLVSVAKKEEVESEQVEEEVVKEEVDELQKDELLKVTIASCE